MTDARAAPPPAPRRLTTPVLASLLVAGAIARAIVVSLPGTRDVPDWKATAFVASEDLLGVYGSGGSPPEQRMLTWGVAATTTEYPMVSQLQMATVGWIYRRFDPDFNDSPRLTALIKTPGLVAELAFVLVLLTWGRRVIGEAAVWAAIAFWLNPAVWLTGSVLGYLDAQMAVPVTIAMIAAAAGRPGLAGVLAAIAVFTKPQAVFVLPVLGIMVLVRNGQIRWRSALTTLIAGLVVTTAALLPLALAGVWPSYWRAVQRLGEHDLVSGTATNLWWIVTWAAGSAARLSELGLWEALSRPATMVRISTVVAAGWPNPRTVGIVLTAAALAWAVWRMRRGVSAPVGALVGGWCVLAYFMVSGQVHENHAYLAVPLLGVAAAARPRLRPLYWAISAAYVLNLYLFYGLGMTLPPVIDRRWTFIDLSVLLAVGYAGLVAWLTMEVVRATRSATTPPAATGR